MLGIAKSFLLFDKVETFAEVCARIEALEAGILRDIAAEVFDERSLSSLIYPAARKS
jgi:hypothetical protein